MVLQSATLKRPYLQDASGNRINVTADNGSVMHVRHNYWTVYNWSAQNGALVFPEDPIINPILEGAPCPVIEPPWPPGGQIPPPLSGLALDITNAQLYRD